MEDLLKEDEFITTKYSPWKRFGLFYVINFIIAPLYYIINRLILDLDPNEFVLIFIIIILPFCLPFSMIFHKKEIADLPLKTIALAVFILMMSSFFSVMLIGIINNLKDFFNEETLLYVLMLTGCYLLGFLLIIAIILPIVRFKQKKRIKLRSKS